LVDRVVRCRRRSKTSPTIAFALLIGLGAAARTSDSGEDTLFKKAQSSGLFSDYQAYLSAYPNGTYTDAARFEMQWALKSGGGNGLQTGIAFDTPLVSDDPDLNGKTIDDLIYGTPLFAPIEGLPDALWKDAACSSCHAWTKDALCVQGMTYTGLVETKALEKQHPYGGILKSALRTFAVEGCK